MVQTIVSVKRSFHRFVGLDLGGVRGKTTAIAEMSSNGNGALVTRVALRCGDQPWTDETLASHLLAMDPATTVIAVDAPLTHHACGRCVRPACPGAMACEDPAVVWLQSLGEATLSDQSSGVRSANASQASPTAQVSHASHTAVTVRSPLAPARARLVPYAHRATEVSLVERGLWPISRLGGANSPIAARARHLARRLAGAGFALHQNLLEVSPLATVTALFGARIARGRKRDADPWHTRAEILTRLEDLAFAPSSRLAREEVLRNDHCFDAIISAYTGYRWARDGWELPKEGAEVYGSDGWVWAPA
jgi:predicted nuclease with RNAse H fold